MLKNIIFKYVLISFLITALIIFANGCCGVLSNETAADIVNSKHTEGDSQTVVDEKTLFSDEDENDKKLDLHGFSIYIFQKTTGGLFFEKGNPVYFSALYTEKTDRQLNADLINDTLNYRWEIGKDIIMQGKKVSHIFEDTGEYEIILTITDNENSISEKTVINIVELKRPVISLKEYECSVSVEYIIENIGSTTLKNITGFIETPQTYMPYQQVLNVYSDNYRFEKLFDEEWNLISKFELGDLKKGEKISVNLTSDAVISEFKFEKENKEVSDTDFSTISSEDISFYTRDESFLEINNPLIQNIVKNVTGSDDNPITIGEKLYNFVISELDYDYKKLDSKNLDLLSATEILTLKKGICIDYSILYASLCRAAKIPAKIITGIPVLAILQEKTNELNYGHAWVEIGLPHYGWVPIDITHERRFMADNYALNLKTYEGLYHTDRNVSNINSQHFPMGFNYYWDGPGKPEVKQDVIYRVKGLNIWDINMILEGEFLNNFYYILNECQAAINHINAAHGDSWIYNDPIEISLEKSLLEKLGELLQVYEQLYYPQSYAEERNNILGIFMETNEFKRLQIESMENNDFEQYINNYNNFITSLNKLFNAYNLLSSNYNKKYS